MTFEKTGPDRKSMFPGNFGALRLLMAVTVIVGHTPELIDGNRGREFLTTLFGTMSLGEVAVDGFFLISGYMLALSVQKSGSLSNYFIKRVARIYPAFIVAFLFCIVIVNPLAGGSWGLVETLSNVARLVLLTPPKSTTAFAGAPYPALNGAMWTISYEFGCYILLAAMFSLGVLQRRGLVTGIAIVLNLLLLTRPHLDFVRREITFGGGAQNTLRFVTTFCTGAAYRQFLRPNFLDKRLFVACLVIVPFALTSPLFAEPVLILAGGYAIIYLGEAQLGQSLSAIGQKIDLSYGIYLYAWPIQSLAIWKFGLRSLTAVDIVAIAGSGLLAFFSWTFIERPAMRAAIDVTRRRSGRTGRDAVPMVVEDAGAP